MCITPPRWVLFEKLTSYELVKSFLAAHDEPLESSPYPSIKTRINVTSSVCNFQLVWSSKFLDSKCEYLFCFLHAHSYDPWFIGDFKQSRALTKKK